MNNEQKEYYLQEIKEIKEAIDKVIRKIDYFEDYEEMNEDLLDLIDRATDKLFESEEFLFKAEKLVKEGD